MLRNEKRTRLIIPMHKTIKPGTLLQILKTMEMTKEKFVELLK